MPIYNNVVFFCNGVEDNIQEVVFLLKCPFLRPIVLHQLIGIIGEVAQYVVLFICVCVCV